MKILQVVYKIWKVKSHLLLEILLLALYNTICRWMQILTWHNPPCPLNPRLHLPQKTTKNNKQMVQWLHYVSDKCIMDDKLPWNDYLAYMNGKKSHTQSEIRL